MADKKKMFSMSLQSSNVLLDHIPDWFFENAWDLFLISHALGKSSH